MAPPSLDGCDGGLLWVRVSQRIAERMGLHFPPERLVDLQRGLAAAAGELGFDDVAACASWLLSSSLDKTQLQVLATHLTISETYFFRETKTFEVLANSVLPALIHARRGRDQRLRLWSAACCSGEEAYSLAILAHQVLPDLADWHVTILATDMNGSVLRKAVAGSYGEWSFRNTPTGFKERYFTRTGERRYTIRPEIQKLVTFEHLNLVDDVYPSLVTDTNAMDVIFCRNVLMYFAPAQARKVVGNLHHALIDGGWLAVSPSEVSQALFPQFVARNFPEVILYQKSAAAPRAEKLWTPTPSGDVAAPAAVASAPATPAPMRPAAAARLPEPPPDLRPDKESSAEIAAGRYALAASFYEQGRYGEAADTLLGSFAAHAPGPYAFSLLSRTLANQGRLADALVWCDRWIAAEKMNAAAHYLRAVVLLELGQQGEARRSLQRALYLEPRLVLAHFTLGNLARARGRPDEAEKHFANTLHLLGHLRATDVLPESDGLTAGRLTETITAITAPENGR